MMIFVCLGEIKKILGNDYEVTVMVPAGKYWKGPTTPCTGCTSRLNTKKTKNSFNLSRKYCMDKK